MKMIIDIPEIMLDWIKNGFPDEEDMNILIELVLNGKPLDDLRGEIGRCKDCIWWKDSDGFYRRGVHAESQCPINTGKVYEGTGYCYMFEPQERSDKE